MTKKRRSPSNKTKRHQKRKRQPPSDHHGMIPSGDHVSTSVENHREDEEVPLPPNATAATTKSHDDEDFKAAMCLVSFNKPSSPPSAAPTRNQRSDVPDNSAKRYSLYPRSTAYDAEMPLRPITNPSSMPSLPIPSFERADAEPSSNDPKCPASLPATITHNQSPTAIVHSSQSAMASNAKPPSPKPKASSSPKPKHPNPTPCEFRGKISMYTLLDDDALSPTHCFIRQHGIELFVATEEDKKNKAFWESRNFKIKPGYVCTRCKYCMDIPHCNRAQRSMHYPSTMNSIYNSMENWQRYHVHECKRIPKWVLEGLEASIQESKLCAGGRRAYWTESAERLGMANVKGGVIFESDPTVRVKEIESSITPGPPLVEPGDEGIASKYLFMLMSQMECCVFSEEVREGSRSKKKDIVVGYPGFQCKHCHGSKGVGRYFPKDLESFRLPNSNRNVENHLKRCKRCPPKTKEALLAEKERAVANEEKGQRGARTKFFEVMFDRMHDGRLKETHELPPSSVSLAPRDQTISEALGTTAPMIQTQNQDSRTLSSELNTMDFDTTPILPSNLVRPFTRENIIVHDRSGDGRAPVVANGFGATMSIQSLGHTGNRFVDYHQTVPPPARYQNPNTPHFAHNDASGASYGPFGSAEVTRARMTAAASEYQYPNQEHVHNDASRASYGPFGSSEVTRSRMTAASPGYQYPNQEQYFSVVSTTSAAVPQSYARNHIRARHTHDPNQPQDHQRVARPHSTARNHSHTHNAHGARQQLDHQAPAEEEPSKSKYVQI